MREFRVTSLHTGTGFLANRLLIAALLAGDLAGFLVIGLPGFIVIAKRMIEAGSSSQIEMGVVAVAGLATHRERRTYFCELVTDKVEHDEPTRLLGGLIVA